MKFIFLKLFLKLFLNFILFYFFIFNFKIYFYFYFYFYFIFYFLFLFLFFYFYFLKIFFSILPASCNIKKPYMGNMCKHDAHDEKKQSEARIRAKKYYASKMVYHPGPKSKKSALRPPQFFDKILILKMQEVPRSP